MKKIVLQISFSLLHGYTIKVRVKKKNGKSKEKILKAHSHLKNAAIEVILVVGIVRKSIPSQCQNYRALISRGYRDILLSLIELVY